MVKREIIECDVCGIECNGGTLQKLKVPKYDVGLDEMYDQSGTLRIVDIDACPVCRREINKATKKMMDNLVGFIANLKNMKKRGNSSKTKSTRKGVKRK